MNLQSFCVLAAALSLAGCGSDGESATPSGSPAYDTIDIGSSAPAVITAEQASVPPRTSTPANQRTATIVRDGPMFRLDQVWWCDGAVEDCSETGGLFPGQLELDDGCLIVQALPADAPGSIRIVYLGGPHARWDAGAMAVTLASGTTIRLGEPAEFTASWLDAEAYLARHQITSAPDEFLECAERNGGQVLNHAPWDIVDAG